jgi:hypothetical protein
VIYVDGSTPVLKARKDAYLPLATKVASLLKRMERPEL